MRHDFDKEVAAQNPGSAETTEGPQTEEELLAQEKKSLKSQAICQKELEDKLEKAEDNGREVDKDQLAQDTGSSSQKMWLKRPMGIKLRRNC